MAEADAVAAEISQTLDADKTLETMDLETQSNGAEENIKDEAMDASNPTSKRAREEGGQEKEVDHDISKKPKAENSVEEKLLEEHVEGEDEEEGGGEEGEEDDEGDEDEEEEEEVEEGKEGDGEEKIAVSVNLGPKGFTSSGHMYDYFIKLLNYWPTNVNVNKYEYTVLLDLLKKGNMEDDKMVEGVCAFQIRFHPMWNSRCFFFVKQDGSINDFSFGKCIQKILPSHDNTKASGNRGFYQRGARGHHGHGGRGGGGRGGGGRGGGGGGGGRGGRGGGRRGGRGGRGGGRRGRGRRGRGQY